MGTISIFFITFATTTNNLHISMKKRIVTIVSTLCFVICAAPAFAVDLTKATICYDNKEAAFVAKMANTLADDIERVSGVRPKVENKKVGNGVRIVLATTNYTNAHKELKGCWERYAIDTDKNTLRITGADARGLAYGVFHVSEGIGVSPWYWFADVPVDKAKGAKVTDYVENYISKSPTIKYRGIFINDEDWGLKTWSSENYEKELGDIGPKTYDKVCELILRLKGNMVAPAMHTCTGAFYSHPESQKRAAEWNIMITTSHCEPLLFNNASTWEWDKERDGEWNYETNKETIIKKLDNRVKETAEYDNIYTTGMRGLHDEAMKGSTNNNDRARTLEKVFAEQRSILEKYKGKSANTIPQIFVPYKETLDIYDAGLKVPEDITIIWPDDNYGYMKRVSNSDERKRSGHSGVYYHLSYLGTPHDNLWIATTSPALMYEELKKAYDAGADRYWLLNVGDIKPMEIEMTHFLDMAYDFDKFTYDNANKYQAEWLANIYGSELKADFQYILDNYYRLAWDRKPEFMGYEYEWDNDEYNRLHDTDFSFQTGTAQKRLSDYDDICKAYNHINSKVAAELRPALFEMLGFSVLAANQMNRKFLFAQRNHETGNQFYAQESKCAYDSINALMKIYNTQLNGKWNQMMSEVPPGFCAKYQLMPELSDSVTDAYKLPKAQLHPELEYKIDLKSLNAIQSPFRLIEGLGTDWVGLQLGEPLADKAKMKSTSIDIPLTEIAPSADNVNICISVLPMWPISHESSNSILVSVDGGKPVSCVNVFKEWGAEWKIQVLENRKEFVLTFPLDKTKKMHNLTLTIGDPGQIVQRISYR